MFALVNYAYRATQFVFLLDRMLDLDPDTLRLSLMAIWPRSLQSNASSYLSRASDTSLISMGPSRKSSRLRRQQVQEPW